MNVKILGLALLACNTAYAFESTKVLPKGVRNLDIRSLYTQTSKKTDLHGDEVSLAVDLYKPLKFSNILQGEEGLKRTQLNAFMIARGFKETDTVGNFRASLNAQINVWAPVLAWGITDKITLAGAMPYYSTSTDINVGFRSNEGGDALLRAFEDPAVNYYYAAVEASDKFANAVGRLNERLEKNGYEPLDSWNQSGWGDFTLAAKALVQEGPVLRTSTTFGFNAPTGRTDNPNILSDLPYGDGQWDLFAQLTLDQIISKNFFINQFVKYTNQLPDRKEMRWKTFDETVEATRHQTDFKLGDKVDAGISFQYEQDSGLNAGLGGLYYRKFGDRYDVDIVDVKNELKRATDQNALYWQARLGYSTVEAYRRKEFALPMSATIEYRKQYESQNLAVTDFTQIDLNLFF
ncbi:MAG: hypothetical protein EOP10_16490 [Proteobacteria bacterium]|nr:MAG: hypothetical protein EOP10_16490 [Pseudomonadota bacterium]